MLSVITERLALRQSRAAHRADAASKAVHIAVHHGWAVLRAVHAAAGPLAKVAQVERATAEIAHQMLRCGKKMCPHVDLPLTIR